MAQGNRADSAHLSEVQNILKSVGLNVHSMLDRSMKAVLRQDNKIAAEIIQLEAEIQDSKSKIDGALIHEFARSKHPEHVLQGLRSALKIQNQLEEIEDRCEFICRQLLSLKKRRGFPLSDREFSALAALMSKMLMKLIDAYSEKNQSLAREVIIMDDWVDEAIEKLLADLENKKAKFIFEEDKTLYKSILHSLESIADQMTIIGEEIIYDTSSIPAVLVQEQSRQK